MNWNLTILYNGHMQEILAHLIHRKAYSEKELAQKVGVNQQRLSRFLNGKELLPAKDFCLLLQGLDIPVGELLSSPLPSRQTRKALTWSGKARVAKKK